MRYVLTYVNITEEKCYHYVIVIFNIDVTLSNVIDQTTNPTWS